MRETEKLQPARKEFNALEYDAHSIYPKTKQAASLQPVHFLLITFYLLVFNPLVFDRRNPRQGFALEVFEQGAAAGGYIAHFVCEAKLVYSGNAVAAAHE